MTHKVRLPGKRVAVVGVLAGALLVGSPLMSVATAQSAEVGTSSKAAATGNTYGGLTSQKLPVVVDMKANRRQIVRAVTVLRLTCNPGTTGISGTLPDRYAKVPVSKKGKFGVAFGPITQRHADGTSTDFQGRISGKLNAAKTLLSGVWRIKETLHDATGVVTDVCDSGVVSWTAKQ
jgi:hypothetical protein